MDDHLKLDHLLGLMHVAIGDEAHHTRRENQIPLSNVRWGMLDYDEGKARTFTILDALASLCISEPDKQVVAIGLQLQLREGKICFTIAQNQEVKKGLVPYFRQVWDMMKELSLKFIADRLHGVESRPQLQYRRVSPMMPEGIGRDIRIQLFRHIFIYTRAKDKCRVDKHWIHLKKFMERFYKSRSEELSGYECILDRAFRALMEAFQASACKTPDQKDDEYWEAQYSFFEVATCAITRLAHHNPEFCETLVSQVGKSLSP